MQLSTLRYERTSGWTGRFPDCDGPGTLVVVFGASSFADEPAAIHELQQHFANSVVVGCSTAGEVLGATVGDESLVVAIAQFEHSRLRVAVGEVGDATDSRATARDLGRQLFGDELSGVLVFSDGLHVNGTELVRGLSEALPAGTVITGGLAGDGSRFQRTWVVAGAKAPSQQVVVAVGFYGSRVRIGHGSRGGWDTFGPERRITRSVGNVLYELDGKPALALYKEYLGDRAAGLPATALLFPLAIRGGADEGRSLVRTILAVDEQQQSMTFAGDVPEGWHARLMKANFDRLIDGAAGAALATRRDDENALSTLAIAVSCVGRRLVLGERTEEEVEATLDGLPQDTAMVGFYSYGEISPMHDGTCELHNQTMTLTTIQESAG